MVFGSVISSPRGNLSLQKALNLTNLYLENARNSTDLEIILVLCHDAEVSLSQAKRAAKQTEDKSMDDTIATAYLSLGGLLENQGRQVEAKAFYKKSDKWSVAHSAKGVLVAAIGNTVASLSPTSLNRRKQADDTVTLPWNIFPANIRPPIIDFKPPEQDARLSSTLQLACCLELLQADCEFGDIVDTATRNWLQVTMGEPDEQDRLMMLATNVIRAFKRDEFKGAKAIAEVVHLAPVLENDDFRYLIKEFYSGIDHSGLLDVHQLEGLAHLVKGAPSGYMDADDLVKILELLSGRMRDTHQQSTSHYYQLIMAVSHVLDAMADIKVSGIDREKIHEPLSSYLDGLKGSSDPYLVYQAAYAYQALLRVPDDESMWQATMRRSGKVIQGVSGLVSAMKGLDLDRFVESLRKIQEGLSGASEVIDMIKNTYYEAKSLAESGKGFFECLKEGFSFSHKCAWYPALRGADVLIRDGQFAELKKLICEAPCRRDSAFQWGICERLGRIAANSKWDSEIRQSAIAFLEEIYRNDTTWGNQPTIKQWILNILMQLSSQPGGGIQSVRTLLQGLQNHGDDKKQALYRLCRENGPGCHPLEVASPLIVFPSLLDRVQERPDVEGQIRQLRRQRLKEQGNAVYIQPQAIPNLQSRDDTRFPLMEKVEQFLNSDQKVFLLLGESGAGKSTFNKELEHHLWETYKNGGVVPLHVNLPAIDKPEHDMIAKQLRKAEFTEPQIREVKLHRNFVLICDGYDESQQTRNLYTSNRLNQPGEWSAKMLISCRSEYVGSDYRDRFQPGDRNSRPDPALFQEAVITSFSTDQIQEYITQYVSVHRPLWGAGEYKKTLDLIPSLKELVTNPFLMSLSLEVLPRMVDPGQDLSATHITRVALYDQFIEHWLERGKRRHGEKEMGPLERAAFEGLVDEGFARSGIDYMKRLSTAIYKEQDGHPIVRYSRYHVQGAWKAEFFGREYETQLLREACPLVRSGNQHRFIHRSLLEYGISLAVFDPQDWKERMAPEFTLAQRGGASLVLSSGGDLIEVSATVNQEPELNSPLTWRYFTKEPSVLQFLEERVQQEPLFKQQLLDYIEHSKIDAKWCTAASNAITILMRSGMQFNGADLRGIRIARADLSNGMFDSAQLQGSDLRQVDLRGAWLKLANLSNADMADVQLGAPPYLETEGGVRWCLYSPDGKSIAVLLDDYIAVYSTSIWESMWEIESVIGYMDMFAYSPRGDQLTYSAERCAIQIWNILTGESGHILRGHSDDVTSVTYSPQGDRIASASEDTTVKLWDVETGICLHTLIGHTSTVDCIAYSPDGDQIASGSDDCTIRLWHVETGQCNHRLEHDGCVTEVLYSPRGDQFASVASSVRLWNVANGDCRQTIELDRSSDIFAYSPKGNQFASSLDKEVLLIDTETGDTLHILIGHSEDIKLVVYSPQGDLVASTAFEGENTVRLWDTETGVCLRILTGHSEDINYIVFSPNGDQIITCSEDCTIRLWDVGVRTSRRTSSGHTEEVFTVKCSPKGDQVASRSDDRTVRLWDVETGTCQHILRGHRRLVCWIAYSPEGDQLATCSEDTTVRLWDIETGRCTRTLTGHSGVVNKVAYSRQGNRLASCSDDCTARLWDVTSGECLRTLTGHTSGVRDAVYSLNEKQIATCSWDGTAKLWDTETGVCTGTQRGPPFAYQIMYSPQGNLVAIIGCVGSVMLWDIEIDDDDNDSDVANDNGPGRCTEFMGFIIASFSPDGKQIACGDDRGRICLFDTVTGGTLWSSEDHQDQITNIVYSPQGELIVSASNDKYVRLWDAASGRELALIQDFQHCVNDVAWVETPNANYVVAGCEDCVVGMWQVIVDQGAYRYRLHWRTSNGEFDVTGATIQDVQGLSSLNRRILKEFGAVGEPALRLREASKNVTMVSAMSKHKNTLGRSEQEFIDQTNNRVNLPSFKVEYLETSTTTTVVRSNQGFFSCLLRYFL